MRIVEKYVLTRPRLNRGERSALVLRTKVGMRRYAKVVFFSKIESKIN